MRGFWLFMPIIAFAFPNIATPSSFLLLEPMLAVIKPRQTRFAKCH